MKSLNKRILTAFFKAVAPITACALILCGCSQTAFLQQTFETETFAAEEFSAVQSEIHSKVDAAAVLESVPAYSGEPFVQINGNKPFFNTADMTETAFENYSSLDIFERCGAAFACVGKETMPDEERGAIGEIKPTGWHLVKYDFIDGKYLYNRCHLIGFQLSGENANECNLITGTRYLNIEGMLPFENKTAEYVRKTGNHVLYRATPIFEGTNLLASGVIIEALSAEDNGKGLCFNVFCYNVQPGIYIDYSDGYSAVDTGECADSMRSRINKYTVNKESLKFHYPDCKYAKEMSDEKKAEYECTRGELIKMGYSACNYCNP